MSSNIIKNGVAASIPAPYCWIIQAEQITAILTKKKEGENNQSISGKEAEMSM